MPVNGDQYVSGIPAGSQAGNNGYCYPPYRGEGSYASNPAIVQQTNEVHNIYYDMNSVNSEEVVYSGTSSKQNLSQDSGYYELQNATSDVPGMAEYHTSPERYNGQATENDFNYNCYGETDCYSSATTGSTSDFNFLNIANDYGAPEYYQLS